MAEGDEASTAGQSSGWAGVSASVGTVVIVGGGISGLYCALELARAGFNVTVLEAGKKWGGRIETGRLRASGKAMFAHPAEFGPMRFELEISPLLKGLLQTLGLKPASFTQPSSPRLPIAYPVDVSESDRSGNPLTPLQLLQLGVFKMFGFHPYVKVDPTHVDESKRVRVRLPSDEWDEFCKWGDLDPALPHSFDAIRKKRRLVTPMRKQTPLLRDLGFWNALHAVLSPGAVAYVNHLGTFYHLMPDNPNAVEWGIFWLRLFGPKSQLSTLPQGVREIGDGLRRLLENHRYPEVDLRLEKVVTGLSSNASDQRPVIEFEDSRTRVKKTLSADHVILALPARPLKRLAKAFSPKTRKALSSVIPFPLLKVFAVVPLHERWRFSSPKPHQEVWMFPTREAHYFVDRANSRVMILLYMDRPAGVFWEQYLESPTNHHQAEIDKSEDLRLTLGEALGNLHWAWAAGVLSRRVGGEANRPSLPLVRHDTQPVIQLLMDLVHAVRDNQRREFAASRGVPRDLFERLTKMSRKHLEWLSLGRTFDNFGANFFTDFVAWREREIAIKIIDEMVLDPTTVTNSVVSSAIRAWGKDDHIGAGCHAWKPRAKSWEVREHLKAFALDGAKEARVHVCGEAYSDYQGFIEGALRSAKDALGTITPR